MHEISIYNDYKVPLEDYTSRRISPSQEVEKLFNIRIWRVKDVADFLGCSIGHIYNLSSDEKIPRIKKGKFVYFIPEKILNWVEEGNLI